MTDHAVVVALTRTRRDVLVEAAAHVLAGGGDVTFVVGARGPWEPLPDGVRVVELLPLEEAHWTTPLLFADRQPWRAPIDRVLARGLDGIGRRLAQAAPGLGARIREAGWQYARPAERGRPGRQQRWFDSATAAQVRPWLLWRALRADRAALSSLANADLVIWGDQQAWPVAWHVARRAPAARVVGFFDAKGAVGL
ncbi:MAG: hypothetical protein JO079_08035 [Frankiaceae bacterium]|nr:hypothetical protein [Frankiaceae bacterium]MBV9368824.1 hypothetical protein [Frankiales bacterium]